MDESRPLATSVRHEYTRGGLSQQQAGDDPMQLVENWIEQAATESLPYEPSTACLSTVGKNGSPSGRMVIIRRIDHERAAFCFYTSHRSRKAQELGHHAVGALTFFWGELERQIRVVGRVEQLPRLDSERYFATRPEGSQISAWQSGHQSTPVGSRQTLDEAAENVQRDEATGEVLCPPFWGGYAVIADEVEFWAGRPSRLHDRVIFLRSGSSSAAEALTNEADERDSTVWNQTTDPHGISWMRARLRP
jgi:pyridoxamine 5'-phosphate oxidase